MSGTLENQLQEILDIKQDIADAITTMGVQTEGSEPFASYVDKITSIEGSAIPVGSFGLFDTKVVDHILTDKEARGWAKQGSNVYKTDYPTFYEKCLDEYNNGVDSSAYAYSHHQPTSGLKDDKGILSGFSVQDYSFVPGVPQNVQSYEIAARFCCHNIDGSHQGILANSDTNKRTPQIVITAGGMLAYDHPKSLDTWAGVSSYISVQPNVWYDVKLVWDGTTGRLFCKQVGEQEWISGDKEIPCTTCSWVEQLAIGADRVASEVPFKGEIDLNGCYVDINGERWWSGTTRVPVKQCVNGHKYYDIEHKTIVDKSFELFGKTDLYGIDTQLEYINLPKCAAFTQEDEIRNIYYCVGNVETGNAVVDVTNHIQLNNPFSLGMSNYFEQDPQNLCWLKSTGLFESGDLYPSMYEWILDNYNCGKPDFHTIQDAYTDYSFVIDIENKTFRLPILNGSEDKFSYDRVDNLNFSGDDIYVAPANGWYHLVKITGTTNQVQACIVRQEDGIFASGPSNRVTVSNNSTIAMPTHLQVQRGETIRLFSNGTGATSACKFFYATGNGSLYYYVGETVQNAHLINASKVQESILQLKDSLKTMLDGDIVPVGVTLASNATISANRVTYDISNILPKDDYNYEVMVCGQVLTKATKGSYVNLYVTSDIQTNSIFVSGIVAASAYQVNTMGCALVVVGKQRILNVEPNTSGTGTYYLYVQNYKRLGKIV